MNVFIKEGEKDRWPAFNTPALGDFGLYKILKVDHITNDTGTPGFMAPEEYGPYPSIPLRPDVFLIGFTIYNLMRRNKRGMNIADHEDRQHNLASLLKREDQYFGYDSIYSLGLEELVARCMQENPAPRIDLNTLFNKVVAGRQAHTEEVNGGSYANCTAAQVHKWDRVTFRKREFSLGEVENSKSKKRKTQ
jgi:serine/threonine protein kinase